MLMKLIKAINQIIRDTFFNTFGSRAVFLNRWAMDSFQRASNLVILLSFVAKL
jgi:hypothetical protein